MHQATPNLARMHLAANMVPRRPAFIAHSPLGSFPRTKVHLCKTAILAVSKRISKRSTLKSIANTLRRNTLSISQGKTLVSSAHRSSDHGSWTILLQASLVWSDVPGMWRTRALSMCPQPSWRPSRWIILYLLRRRETAMTKEHPLSRESLGLRELSLSIAFRASQEPRASTSGISQLCLWELMSIWWVCTLRSLSRELLLILSVRITKKSQPPIKAFKTQSQLYGHIEESRLTQSRPLKLNRRVS